MTPTRGHLQGVAVCPSLCTEVGPLLKEQSHDVLATMLRCDPQDIVGFSLCNDIGHLAKQLKGDICQGHSMSSGDCPTTVSYLSISPCH